MDAPQALHIATRIAIEQEGDTKLALLEVCAALGTAIGQPAEAQLTARIAANLRAAEADEQTLLDLINPSSRKERGE